MGRLMPDGPGAELMVGVEHGDDGAVVRVSPALALVVTADPLAPVVDDALPSGGSPRPTPCPTSTQWAASRWSR